jgi:hypothetical protein
MTRMSTETQQLPNIFNRSPDTQYQEMDNLLDSAKFDMGASKEVICKTSDINFIDIAGSIGLSIKPAKADSTDHALSHYSMMQTCRMARIDVDIIRRLRQRNRNDLAIDNLNTLFARASDDHKIILLDEHRNVRAVNGADYSRLWDYQIFDAVHKCLIPAGFRPASLVNGCGLLVKNNGTALFRGDQTSFGFFFTNSVRHETPLGSMRQGMMIWNSEVGARSFGYSNFYFREESGTFLFWDSAQKNRKRFVHRGDITKGFGEYMKIVKSASNIATSSFDEDFAIFNNASITPFAKTDDEAIEKLNKLFDMNKDHAIAVIKASRLPQNCSGNDLSVWRISLGIAYEASMTSRAESMVDDSILATKIIRRTSP